MMNNIAKSPPHQRHAVRPCSVVLLVCLILVSRVAARTQSRSILETPIVLTQLPVGTEAERRGPLADGMLRAQYGDRARLVILNPDLSVKIISQGFYAACDPEISFDAAHILFAGKRNASDNWNIFEAKIDGSNVRQVTDRPGDCRSPSYQGKLYTIVSTEPWYQLTFVGTGQGAFNEYGPPLASDLYSCKLDGSAVRRLTFNLSSDIDPFIQSDGRVLFAAWQRSTLNRGRRGRIALFGINIDGTDYAAFSTDQGKRIKHMPCTTTKGLAIFVEAETVPWDGAGTLGSVSLRRPLHSYRPVTTKSAGLFHSPSPLPDGDILVSRRLPDGPDTRAVGRFAPSTHGVGRLDPSTGQFNLIFDDVDFHDIQAKAIYLRPEPDGRSSVVNETDPNGKLYCLNVNVSDIDTVTRSHGSAAKRLRVLEGIPPKKVRLPPLAHRRILGEIDIEPDGSFNIEVPANTPIELQTIDADGMALRTCTWIWAKNREPRGCIGCHEDGELTPENTLVQAVTHPSIKLTAPPEQRRTVDFRHDIMPIIERKCVGCHDKPNASVRLTPDPDKIGGASQIYGSLLAPRKRSGTRIYVRPGQARTSPLIWHIFGRNTSRPWDDTFSQKPIKKMPPAESAALTDKEKRTFVEWIDTGAAWSSGPHEKKQHVGGSEQ